MDLGILIKTAVGGDEEASNRLLSRYHDRVRTIAVAETGEVLRHHYPVEDIIQEAQVALFRGLKSLDLGDEPIGNFEAWLRVVTRNVVAAYGRRAKKSLRQMESDLDYDDGPSPSRLERRRERIYRLSEAIRSLSEPEQQVVHMHYFRRMTLDEIAIELDQKRSAVNSRLMRARPKLRAWLGSTSMNLSSS